MPDSMLDALKALIRLELKVGEFYEACARRWPEDEQFWLAVAHQEEVHARAIERMASLIAKNPALYAPARAIRVAAVNTIVAGIESTMEQLQRGQVVKLRALTTAVDLENSLMEKGFFAMIQTADPAFLQLRHGIIEQTREHKERFETRLSALKA
jgi:hypothetical protein